MAESAALPDRMPRLMDEASTIARVENGGLKVTKEGKHYKVSRPGEPGMVQIPVTPSDHRALRNVVMAIRRTFGVDVRRHPEKGAS